MLWAKHLFQSLIKTESIEMKKIKYKQYGFKKLDIELNELLQLYSDLINDNNSTLTNKPKNNECILNKRNNLEKLMGENHNQLHQNIIKILYKQQINMIMINNKTNSFNISKMIIMMILSLITMTMYYLMMMT